MSKLKRLKDVVIGDNIYCLFDNKVDIMKLTDIIELDGPFFDGVFKYEFENISNSPCIHSAITKLVFENDFKCSILYLSDETGNVLLCTDKQQAINILKNNIKELQENINKLEING
jgi:hypothetical protein